MRSLSVYDQEAVRKTKNEYQHFHSKKKLMFTCFSQHCSKKFSYNTSSLSHLTLFGVGQVRDDSNNVASRASSAGIGYDHQLHDVIVHISGIETFDSHIKYKNRVKN